MLLGVYTKRGMGISKHTWKAAQSLLPLIHQAARTRPVQTPYVAIQVNEYSDSGCPTHQDKFNMGDSWVIGVGMYKASY